MVLIHDIRINQCQPVSSLLINPRRALAFANCSIIVFRLRFWVIFFSIAKIATLDSVSWDIVDLRYVFKWRKALNDRSALAISMGKVRKSLSRISNYR